ncbi:uncharacterized protein LOC144102346 [Amblyomma americanum]
MSQIFRQPRQPSLASLSAPQNKIYQPRNLQQPNPTMQYRQEIFSAFVLLGFIISALVVFALMRTTPSGEDVKGSAQKEVVGLPDAPAPDTVATTSTGKTPKPRAATERSPTARKPTDMDTTEELPVTTEEEMKVPTRQMRKSSNSNPARRGD